MCVVWRLSTLSLKPRPGTLRYRRTRDRHTTCVRAVWNAFLHEVVWHRYRRTRDRERDRSRCGSAFPTCHTQCPRHFALEWLITGWPLHLGVLRSVTLIRETISTTALTVFRAWLSFPSFTAGSFRGALCTFPVPLSVRDSGVDRYWARKGIL